MSAIAVTIQTLIDMERLVQIATLNVQEIHYKIAEEQNRLT